LLSAFIAVAIGKRDRTSPFAASVAGIARIGVEIAHRHKWRWELGRLVVTLRPSLAVEMSRIGMDEGIVTSIERSESDGTMRILPSHYKLNR
jgi:hypothetical protein